MAVNLPPAFFEQCFSQGLHTLSLIRYSEQISDPEAAGIHACRPHRDWGFCASLRSRLAASSHFQSLKLQRARRFPADCGLAWSPDQHAW